MYKDAEGTAYAQQRYVTSSGEVFWIFILRNKATKEVMATWQAPDHPCFGNGGKPVLVPHPFGGVEWNNAKGCYVQSSISDSGIETKTDVEIIVSNPSLKQVEIMRAMTKVSDEEKPDLDLIDVIKDFYVLDEDTSPAWPDKAVTVGLPEDYEAMPYGQNIQTVKKTIPASTRMTTRNLVFKKSARGQAITGNTVAVAQVVSIT